MPNPFLTAPLLKMKSFTCVIFQYSPLSNITLVSNCTSPSPAVFPLISGLIPRSGTSVRTEKVGVPSSDRNTKS